MGMFDSFYVGNTEIQTKSLDNALQNYHLGDIVPSLSDSECNYILFESDHHRTKPKQYALIVYDNLYIDVITGDPNNEDELSERATNLLNAYIANPSLIAMKLAFLIKHELQPKYRAMKAGVYEMRSAAVDYESYLERLTAVDETENAHRAIRRMFGPSEELSKRYDEGLLFHEYIKELAKPVTQKYI